MGWVKASFMRLSRGCVEQVGGSKGAKGTELSALWVQDGLLQNLKGTKYNYFHWSGQCNGSSLELQRVLYHQSEQ
eukprot:scaffold214192_cov23-Tisochrysis_lutea.AAC.1